MFPKPGHAGVIVANVGSDARPRLSRGTYHLFQFRLIVPGAPSPLQVPRQRGQLQNLALFTRRICGIHTETDAHVGVDYFQQFFLAKHDGSRLSVFFG
jgi:hypothetical protein